VPALLAMLGERAWYMPRWLDRLLPDITIEPPQGGEPRREREPQRPPALDQP
jgi:putative drug exporter of the RND superfamily